MHIIAVLSMLVGWHLDEIDARLIEENREALRVLNIHTMRKAMAGIDLED